MDRVYEYRWPSVEEIVRYDLQPYFDAVVKEVARHVPEKGYGYRNKEWIDYFIERTHKLAHNYLENPDNSGEALDIGAMAAFSWLHQTGSFPLPKPTSVSTSGKRSTEVEKMKVQELIELNDKAHEILGWAIPANSLELGYNVEEVDDVWLYVDVHQGVIGGDLCECFNDLKAKLEAVFGHWACGFDFFENEKSDSGYGVAIPLRLFSTNTHEKRSTEVEE